jgi:hypothetical protein
MLGPAGLFSTGVKFAYYPELSKSHQESDCVIASLRKAHRVFPKFGKVKMEYFIERDGFSC